MSLMLPNVEVIHRPESVAKAVKLLGTAGAAGAALAGGTALAVSGRKGLTELVDLTGLNLAGVKVTGTTIRLGAMTTMAQIANHPGLVRDGGTVLRQAAIEVGSVQTRNLCTLGGNVCQLMPWCHMPVAMLALDAVAYLAGTEQKAVDAVTFLNGPPRRILGPSGLVKEVQFQNPKSLKAAFLRFARTRTDRAILTVAVSYRVNRGQMDHVRAAAGGLTPKPQRIEAVEETLAGEKPKREAFDALDAVDLSGVEIASDMRASREFKAELLKVLLKRGFLRAWGKE